MSLSKMLLKNVTILNQSDFFVAKCGRASASVRQEKKSFKTFLLLKDENLLRLFRGR